MTPSEDFDAKYRVNLGDDPQLMEGEIRLLKLLMDGLERRIGSGATPEERQAAFLVMVEEDAEMAAMVERLYEMSRCHSRSLLNGLISLAEEDDDDDEVGSEK
jgi:hypothetical protein